MFTSRSLPDHAVDRRPERRRAGATHADGLEAEVEPGRRRPGHDEAERVHTLAAVQARDERAGEYWQYSLANNNNNNNNDTNNLMIITLFRVVLDGSTSAIRVVSGSLF